MDEQRRPEGGRSTVSAAAIATESRAGEVCSSFVSGRQRWFSTKRFMSNMFRLFCGIPDFRFRAVCAGHRQKTVTHISHLEECFRLDSSRYARGCFEMGRDVIRGRLNPTLGYACMRQVVRLLIIGGSHTLRKDSEPPSWLLAMTFCLT